MSSSNNHNPLHLFHDDDFQPFDVQYSMPLNVVLPPFGGGTMIQSSISSSSSAAAGGSNFLMKEQTGGGSYDLSDLDDHGLFHYLDHDQVHANPNSSRQIIPHANNQIMNTSDQMMMMMPPSLNISPSSHMYDQLVDPPSNMDNMINDGLVSPATTGSNPQTDSSSLDQSPTKSKSVIKKQSNQKAGPSLRSEKESLEPKVLRRLAQNREAARKSRLKKKVYVQQLESSRVKLTQLEQELQRGLSQGGVGDQAGNNTLFGKNINPHGGVFNMEYARWLHEQNRLVAEVKAFIKQDNDNVIPDQKQMRMVLDKCMLHYEALLSLKDAMIKFDVFHLISGAWKFPTERSYMWIGGFRPSHLIKVIINYNMEPFWDQPILGIYELQQMTQKSEQTLSTSYEMFNLSLSDTIGMNSTNNMTLAINKLSTIEDFVRQAELLRKQTINRLYNLLTTHQAARCFVAIHDYFNRLRALGSIWMTCPRTNNVAK
ncbi:transcription factor TGA2-like [Impatiens glandulifera]|uniref:transcription factor TGA2-like n=1 Tax=Impatiens glandulifera TaxID=253017 RepID=UPI001FB05EC8|nr:transcription factor TGA2-like [Impatiens glandulifera]